MADPRLYDFREFLEFLTGQKWEALDDLPSENGRDYYYFCNEDESEAYLLVDGERLKVIVDDEKIFEGNLSDNPVRVFINRRTDFQHQKVDTSS